MVMTQNIPSNVDVEPHLCGETDLEYRIDTNTVMKHICFNSSGHVDEGEGPRHFCVCTYVWYAKKEE